jgi:hypothetical protein
MGFENFGSKLDVRAHLESLGLAPEGTVITPEDFEAIEARTKVLIREARERGAFLSEEDALPMAFLDRRMAQGQLGINDIIDAVEPETFRVWLGGYAGREYTMEESEAFIRYMRGEAEQSGVVFTEAVTNWAREREEVTQDIPQVAVADKSDIVRGVGGDARELMRRAQEEK